MWSTKRLFEPCDLKQFSPDVIPLASDSVSEKVELFLSLFVHCCLLRGQLQIWIGPIDFKSPEAETLVLSRLPCQPPCSLARAVVVHKLTASGMERCL